MSKRFEITPADFDRLLKWFDDDRAVAAEKYRKIHRRMVQIFRARGAFPAEDLADQTLDRIIKKLPEIINDYEGDPALYIFSMARNVYFEFVRKPKPMPLPELFVMPKMEANENVYQTCLKNCLEKISPEEKQLFIDYFLYDNEKKLARHEEMARRLGINRNYLRTRIYRIRMALEKCVKECVGKK